MFVHTDRTDRAKHLSLWPCVPNIPLVWGGWMRRGGRDRQPTATDQATPVVVSWWNCLLFLLDLAFLRGPSRGGEGGWLSDKALLEEHPLAAGRVAGLSVLEHLRTTAPPHHVVIEILQQNNCQPGNQELLRGDGRQKKDLNKTQNKTHTGTHTHTHTDAHQWQSHIRPFRRFAHLQQPGKIQLPVLFAAVLHLLLLLLDLLLLLLFGSLVLLGGATAEAQPRFPCTWWGSSPASRSRRGGGVWAGKSVVGISLGNHVEAGQAGDAAQALLEQVEGVRLGQEHHEAVEGLEEVRVPVGLQQLKSEVWCRLRHVEVV